MKYIKKISLVIMFFGFTSFAVTDNFEAWDIKPIDGNTALTFSIFDEVKVIQENLGAKVEYWQHDVMGDNVVSYVIRFNTGSEWASFKDKLAQSEEFQNWISEYWPILGPNVLASYSLNNIIEPSADKNIWKDANVVHFSAWEAFPGRGVDMIESMQKSIAISKKYDLDAYTYSSGLGQVFFVMTGESWSDLQKKIEKRNASNEWNQYWMGINNDPSGNFVRAAYSVRVN